MPSGALEGIRVLDLGRIQAAPYCAAIMADLGADVIKVEQPGTGDDAREYLPRGTYFANFNRGKRGVTINLKTGKDVFLKLVETADVLVENFRPGVMERLGLGYEELSKVNPGLVYCSISAFGQSGPYSQKAGFDPLLQAMTGIMSVTGFPDGDPVRAGIAVSDIMGGLNAAIGILAALRYREKTGKGQMVDISLADGAISSMSSINQSYLTDREIRGRLGNAYGTGAPGGVYEASDGTFMYAGANDPAWAKVCSAMGRPELITDPRYATRNDRAKNRAEVDAIMNEWTRQHTVAENIEIFEGIKLSVGPILNVEQVYNDPHFGKNGARPMFREMQHPELGTVEYTGPVVNLSETPAALQRPSPMLGEHNDEIYSQIGYSPEDIMRFRSEGII